MKVQNPECHFKYHLKKNEKVKDIMILAANMENPLGGLTILLFLEAFLLIVDLETH